MLRKLSTIIWLRRFFKQWGSTFESQMGPMIMKNIVAFPTRTLLDWCAARALQNDDIKPESSNNRFLQCICNDKSPRSYDFIFLKK